MSLFITKEWWNLDSGVTHEPGGFCSVQRRYTLVERVEVRSIYPPPEWGNWHSKNGPVYSWWEQKWLCFLKEEFSESWQKFRPLFSSTCEFMARNLSFTSTCRCSVARVSISLRPHGLHTPGAPVLHYPLQFVQIWVHWVGDAMQSSHPLSSPSPPALNLSPASGSFLMSQLFTQGDQSIGASVSASVLPMNIQSWFPLGRTGLVSLQSKGLSGSSPAPQFKSITFSVLSLLSGPTLTSVHDYWKHRCCDCPDLCQQSHVSAFECAV